MFWKDEKGDLLDDVDLDLDMHRLRLDPNLDSYDYKPNGMRKFMTKNVFLTYSKGSD